MPCSQTDVAGLIATTTEPRPVGVARSLKAIGSQRPRVCLSPEPGTSGENRAEALALLPGASLTITAVS